MSMTHQFIKTNLALIASSIALTACVSLSSETSSAESSAVQQSPVTYGTPDWARLSPGKVTCNEGKNYTIIQAEAGKHMTINWLNKQYVLYHVPTSTGTYRYEDKASGLVIVQIPEKSLLLNSKIGQRLADECRKR
ncbi:MAG: hypothetical protein ACRCWR_00720 [Saezia sp.]